MSRKIFTMPGCSLLVVCLLLSPAFVSAQEDHHGHPELERDASLSLADVVEMALVIQPRWNEASVRREQTQAMKSVSESLIAGQPVFNLNYLDDVVIDDIGEREIQAGMTFPLWWPGQRKNATGLAEAIRDEHESWEDGLAWSVAGEVRRLLADIELAEARLLAAEEAVEDAEALLALTQSLQRAGEVAEADVMLARGRLLDARSAEVETEASVVDTHREYSVYTGLEKVPASGLNEVMAEDAAITPEHPLLAEYADGLDRARFETEQQRLSSRGNPTVTVGARNQRADQLTDANTTLALGFSIPLGGKRFTTAKVAEARRREVDIEIILLEQQRDLQTSLHEVEHEMLVTGQKLGLAEENAALNEARWTMARSAYELGEIDMPQVILALQQFRAARLQLVVLQIQQKALVSAFNQTLGVMP